MLIKGFRIFAKGHIASSESVKTWRNFFSQKVIKNCFRSCCCDRYVCRITNSKDTIYSSRGRRFVKSSSMESRIYLGLIYSIQKQSKKSRLFLKKLQPTLCNGVSSSWKCYELGTKDTHMHLRYWFYRMRIIYETRISAIFQVKYFKAQVVLLKIGLT